MLSPAFRARLDKPISYRQISTRLWTTYWNSFHRSLRKGRVRKLRSQTRKKGWRGEPSCPVLSMAPYVAESWEGCTPPVHAVVCGEEPVELIKRPAAPPQDPPPQVPRAKIQ